MDNIEDIVKDAIQKATSERGNISILIAGRSGVGKSTLINAVFQQKMAETGQGKPVTQNTREITKEGVPLTIFDTRGLEMSEFQETHADLERLIKERSSDRDSNRHIHVAWLCIQEDGRRVEQAEIDLHNMLARHMPVISVVTKARSDNGFKNEVQRLLPESRNVIRVRAIQEEMDDGYIIKAMGLESLIELTSEVIPEGKRRALAAAQRANINYRKTQSHKIVVASATAAAAAGASPIPFSDAAILAPIQVTMIAGITSVFGLELSKGTLTTLVASAIGVGGATFLGRTVVVNILKCFPGVGTVAGGAISAATASAITVGLGEAYIAVLAEIFTKDPDAEPTATEIGEKLKEKMKKIGS
ncbi:YcjF family protein [Enterobacter cloacae complex sp. 2024EL-00215]|uniref:50S ribosome-binding GTPase n=1 Tax=Enterobacter mori TaxID=539813 RepID=A0A7T0DZX7_9ENTR|nr:GTPase [Enterobacter mori]QPK02589.1 50S ribosome-binding GTPase [Enterobacter mori]